jgi:hypothetical protein
LTKQAYYNERFSYENGVLYWKVVFSNRLKVGDPAGTIDGRGYLRTNIDGKLIGNHLIIWIMHNGEIPPYLQIDHIDQDKLNNSIDNLRLVTPTQNSLNKKSRTHTTGTYYSKERKKWVAQISLNNKNVNLGRFKTQEEAIEAYQRAYKEIHGNFI